MLAISNNIFETLFFASNINFAMTDSFFNLIEIFLISFTGFLGLFLNRQNIIVTLMSIELILLTISIIFIELSYQFQDIYGLVFSFFILTVAAAESAIGLAIVIVYYRLRGSIFFYDTPVLKI